MQIVGQGSPSYNTNNKTSTYLQFPLKIRKIHLKLRPFTVYTVLCINLHFCIFFSGALEHQLSKPIKMHSTDRQGFESLESWCSPVVPKNLHCFADYSGELPAFQVLTNHNGALSDCKVHFDYEKEKLAVQCAKQCKRLGLQSKAKFLVYCLLRRTQGRKLVREKKQLT